MLLKNKTMDRFAQTNNIQLRYLDHLGSDPPLVLMPGLTNNAHSFDGLIQAGLNKTLRVLPSICADEA